MGNVSETKEEPEELSCVVPEKVKLLSDLEAYMSHHETTDCTIKKLEHDNKSLYNQVEDLKAEMKGKEAEHQQELEQTLTNVSESVKSLEAKNEELESHLREKDHTISSLQQQVGQVSKLTTSNQSLETKNKDLESMLTERNTLISSLQQQVQHASNNLTSYHKVKSAKLLFSPWVTNGRWCEDTKSMVLEIVPPPPPRIQQGQGQGQTQNQGASSSSQNPNPTQIHNQNPQPLTDGRSLTKPQQEAAASIEAKRPKLTH